MTYDLKISEAARYDMIDSSEWYDKQRTGLGTEFQREIFKTLKHVQENPLFYSIKFSGRFHFAKTNRFPFMIGYEILENTILVNFIFHTSRNPAKF